MRIRRLSSQFKCMRVLFLLIFHLAAFSQDKEYVKRICDTLASKRYAGRGYTIYPKTTEIGIERARRFIIQEIRSIGAYDLNKYIKKSKYFTKPVKFEKAYFSKKIPSPNIKITTNNILSSYLKIDGQVLILGKEYLPEPSSPSIHFSGTVYKIDSIHYLSKNKQVILELTNRLMHSSSPKQDNIGFVYVNKEIVKNNNNDEMYCEINIRSKLETIKTDNIYAFIPGTLYPDSFIIFSAHYDHLGNIDTAYFPGANDNASGVAVLLDMMRYFKQHPLKYSVAFYFFTGEEIGLLGSEYYVNHPLYDLKRIKFLINLDLMGGGSEGIMVVNGKIFPRELALIEDINKSRGYGIGIKSRGKAKNSDHYWFTEKGVKSFFIYTMGDIKAYHNIDDVSENLKFSNYENIFRLITDWTRALSEMQ